MSTLLKKSKLALAVGLFSLSGAFYSSAYAATTPATEEPLPDYNARICTDGMTADMCQSALSIMCARPDGDKFVDCQDNTDDSEEEEVQPDAPAGSVPNKSNASSSSSSGGATLLFSPSAFASQQAIGFITAFFTCKNEMSEGEKSLALRRGANLCQEVGTYCSKKVKVGFIKLCRTKKKVFCCFNSTLAKIINVQGRKQLGTMTWGSAENPRCEGFTMEQFNSIDISKMDLTEFVNEVSAKANLNVAKNEDYWTDRNTNRTQATWQNAADLNSGDVLNKVLTSVDPYSVFNQPTDGKATAQSEGRIVADETERNTPTAKQTAEKQPVNQVEVDKAKQAVINHYN